MANSRQAGISLRCPDCQGQRLHAVVLIREAGGLVTRQAQCPTCERIGPIPTEMRVGLCCPAPTCGHIFLRPLWTRHYPGKTTRARACRMCGHRIRTTEKISGGITTRPQAAAS